MSSKTIEINPSLFNVGGLSKKNRSKKNKSMSIPLISPNILKNKLLKRIKDHKNKETVGLDTSNKKMSSEIRRDEPVLNNVNTYTDEFNESIEYLQTLSKQKKIESENNIKREAIQRKTIKNYSSSMPAVNLELPDELKETFITVNSETLIPASMTSASMTSASMTSASNTPVLFSHKTNDTPYGILKGGNKPTYRQWNKTQKNYQPNGNNLTINAPKSEREERLSQLKQKLKQQSTVVTQAQAQAQGQGQAQSQPIQIVTQPQIQPIQKTITQPNLEEILLTQNLIQKPDSEFTKKVPIVNNLSQNTDGGGSEKIKTTKKLLKKTIHKKYTLGKSNIKRTVGVLLKDKNTRKNIISAQKDLRDKPVTDVKTYLRQHNLIKIGSNAPNDVIRKIYESAMLAGEITNNNKDIMIHNFIKDDT
jgi:hypothetical protein